MKYLKKFESRSRKEAIELRDFFNKASDIVEDLKYIIEDNGKMKIQYYGNGNPNSFQHGRFSITILNSARVDGFRKSEEFLEFVDRIREELGNEYLVDTSYNEIARNGLDSIGNVKIDIRKKMKWEIKMGEEFDRMYEMVEFGYGYEIKKKEEEILNGIKEYFCDLTDDGFQVHTFNHGINFITLQKSEEWKGDKIVGFDLNLNKKIEPSELNRVIDHIEDFETSYNRLLEDGYKFNHIIIKFLYRWGGKINVTILDRMPPAWSNHLTLPINFNEIIDSIEKMNLEEENIPFEISIKTTIIKKL